MNHTTTNVIAISATVAICAISAHIATSSMGSHPKFIGAADPAAIAGTIPVQVSNEAAPDFELKDAATGRKVRLSSLRGRPVVIAFGSCT